jgi:hypothetical protein
MWPVLQGLEHDMFAMNGPQSIQAEHYTDSFHDANYSLGLNLNINIIMVFSRTINGAEKNQGETYFSRLLSKSKHN